MNFCKLTTTLAFAFVLCISCAQVRAQDQQPQQNPDNNNNAPQAPIPPVTPDETGGTYSQPPVPAGTLIGGGISPDGDTTIQAGSTLGGAETFGIVSPTGKPNVLDPSIHVSVGPDTGIVPGETNTDVVLGGTLALDHFWARNEFTTQYTGGVYLYTPASVNNSQYHVLSIADSTQYHRITLRLRDDFSDSSGAVFGGLNTGGPGLGVPTGFISTLSPTFTLAQTILTTNANRIGNTVVGEFDYAISRHSTLTFAASDQLLHFLTSGYIDSRYVDGRVGYSLQIDRKNAIALIYDYNYTTFNGGSGPLASQTAQFAYGLRVSGRMALQVTGGPEIISLPNTGTGGTNQLSWTVSTVLTYQMRRTSYSLSYSHGLTNGSGVFLGALSDTVTGTVQTAFHRNWTPSLTGGYSDNNTLSIDSATSNFFGNWYGTVSLGRTLGHQRGRIFHATASYGLQEQTTNAASCPVASCGPNALRQVFTITVDWHPLPNSNVQ